jgi:predicted negative regulator of RcsB-dependent stress response
MALQLRALDLEISLSRFDDALTRVDLLTSASERRELWLKRRGDILVSAGRQAEARATYVAAQTAIAALPAWLAASPDTVRLSTELTRLATTSP